MKFAALSDEIFIAAARPSRHCSAGLRGEVIDADKLELVGELAGLRQIVERRDDQALGEVAGGAEDHHGAWRRGRGAFGVRTRRDFRGPLSFDDLVVPVQASVDLFLYPSRFAQRRDCRGQLRPSASMATATTRSGSKPNLRCSSLSGAEAPNVFMPMMRPAAPT